MNRLLETPTVNYCEKAGSGLIKRPYYAFTNLAFLLVSAVIYFKNPKSNLVKLFAGTSLLIGLLSFNYDAQFIRWAQILDLFGMMIFAGLLLFLNLKDIVKISKKLLITTIGVVIFLSEVLIYLVGGYAGNVIFGLMILVYIGTEGYFHHKKLHDNYKYWYWAFGLFVAAFIYWTCDTKEIICFKIGLFNGRSVFHYVTAVCIYLLYTFYASQKNAGALE